MFRLVRRIVASPKRACKKNKNCWSVVPTKSLLVDGTRANPNDDQTLTRGTPFSLSLSLSPCSSSSDHPAAGRRRRSRLRSRRLPSADHFRFPNRTQSKSPLDLATGGLLPDHRLLPRNHCLERQQQCRCQHQERPSRSTRSPQQTLTRSTRSRRPRRRRRRMWSSSSSSTRGTTTIPL